MFPMCLPATILPAGGHTGSDCLIAKECFQGFSVATVDLNTHRGLPAESEHKCKFGGISFCGVLCIASGEYVHLAIQTLECKGACDDICMHYYILHFRRGVNLPEGTE